MSPAARDGGMTLVELLSACARSRAAA
jgi:hypothetical protein